MNKVEEAQYKNLRYNFNKNLIVPILGKDYYNMSMDVYESDRIATEDIYNEFTLRNTKIVIYRGVLIVMFIINAFFMLFKAFRIF